MEILLFIIGAIVFVCLLGSFFEHQDKAKEEQRQNGITDNARVAMYNKHPATLIGSAADADSHAISIIISVNKVFFIIMTV